MHAVLVAEAAGRSGLRPVIPAAVAATSADVYADERVALFIAGHRKISHRAPGGAAPPVFRAGMNDPQRLDRGITSIGTTALEHHMAGGVHRKTQAGIPDVDEFRAYALLLHAAGPAADLVPV